MGECLQGEAAKGVCPPPTTAPTTSAPTTAPTTSAPTTSAPTTAPTTSAPIAAIYDLYIGAPGLNCDTGYDLEDENACETFAGDNDIDFKGNTASSDRPKGCYAQHTKAGARVGVYFNTATATKRNVWGRTRAICKTKDFAPDFNYVKAFGGRNCASDKVTTSSFKCAEAAAEMGLALRGEIKSMKRPAGCYVDSRNKVYFNTRLVAYQGGRYGRRGTGICSV